MREKGQVIRKKPDRPRVKIRFIRDFAAGSSEGHGNPVSLYVAITRSEFLWVLDIVKGDRSIFRPPDLGYFGKVRFSSPIRRNRNARRSNRSGVYSKCRKVSWPWRATPEDERLPAFRSRPERLDPRPEIDFISTPVLAFIEE